MIQNNIILNSIFQIKISKNVQKTQQSFFKIEICRSGTEIRAAQRHTQTHERNHAHINTIIPLPSVAISLCLFLFCQPAIHLLIPTTHTLPLLLHHADPTSTPQPLLWPRSTLPPLISLFFSPPPLPQYLYLFFILSLVLSFASPLFPLFNSHLMLFLPSSLVYSLFHAWVTV